MIKQVKNKHILVTGGLDCFDEDSPVLILSGESGRKLQHLIDLKIPGARLNKLGQVCVRIHRETPGVTRRKRAMRVNALMDPYGRVLAIEEKGEILNG
jgi:hypothetical protein